VARDPAASGSTTRKPVAPRRSSAVLALGRGPASVTPFRDGFQTAAVGPLAVGRSAHPPRQSEKCCRAV
jgi:hypothetical protein